jgi:predicted TIM-barrel fold metal-dependent hydrolase
MRAIFLSAVFLFSIPFASKSFASEASELWRAEHRLIDLHQHIDYSPEHLARAVRIMDAAGIGVAVNLSGDVTTSKDGEPSPFEKNKTLADKLFPGRFAHYMSLDYRKWNEPNFSEDAVKQIEAGYRLGAAGFKEYKRLGLYLRDKEGKLLKIDDSKLDPVWAKCGELKMPVSIHVADPRAFWLPYDATNERWKELKDHRLWWFGDTNTYPRREELLEALNRVIERHPKTTFVCVHFANNAEDLDWVDRMLDKYPNMNADLAARIPEIGRQDPEKVRKLFIKHQERIFFATDFQVSQQLTLGSGGSGPAPTDEDAQTFFAKHWRWLETSDRNFAHMTPIQGDWTISGIALPDEVLRKIYFDNARRLLARALPFATLRAQAITEDFAIDPELKNPAWAKAAPAHMEYESATAKARPDVSTTVRALWTERFLYLGYDSPYTELAMFEPAFTDKERIGLWDKDVVEAFIAPDPGKVNHYSEYEVAPTGEKIDLILEYPEKKDFEWSSRFETAAHIDKEKKHWTAVMKIPVTAFGERAPKAGDHWRINTYRIDRANKAFLALNPTLTGNYHTPERFGHLQFDP